MGDMLAFADNPFFVVGTIVAVGCLITLGRRAWARRNEDAGGNT